MAAHETTRRTALVAIGTGAALTALPLAVAAKVEARTVSTAEWDKALAACEEAEAAWRTYHRDVIEPAHARYEQIVGGPGVRVYPAPTPEQQARIDAASAAYDALEKRFGDLVTMHCEKVEALMLTPAPTIAALAEKLRVASKNEVHEFPSYPGLMAAMIQDADRLAKRED